MTEQGPLKPYAAIRWAREMSVPPAERQKEFRDDWRAPNGLPRTESQVLLVLATYADKDTGECYPSIVLIARRCGLKITEYRHAHWPPEKDTVLSCRPVSRALKRLEDLELLKSVQRPGTSAKRFLWVRPLSPRTECLPGHSQECLPSHKKSQLEEPFTNPSGLAAVSSSAPCLSPSEEPEEAMTGESLLDDPPEPTSSEVHDLILASLAQADADSSKEKAA